MGLARGLKYRWGEAWILLLLASICRARAEEEKSNGLAEPALKLFREVGDRRGIAWALVIAGHLARDQGDLDSAEMLHQQATTLARQIGDRLNIAMSLEGRAMVQLTAVGTAPAFELWAEAVAIRTAIGAALPPIEQDEYRPLIEAIADYVKE